MNDEQYEINGSVIDVLFEIKANQELYKKLVVSRSKVSRYFRDRSYVMTAIKKHISDNQPCDLIEAPRDEYGEYLKLAVYPETNTAVIFKRAKICETSVKSNCFSLEFYVRFYSDQDLEDGTVVKSYNLIVPNDLEENFTQEKFDAWAKEQGSNLREATKKSELALLKTLVERYPKELKEFTEYYY